MHACVRIISTTCTLHAHVTRQAAHRECTYARHTHKRHTRPRMNGSRLHSTPLYACRPIYHSPPISFIEINKTKQNFSSSFFFWSAEHNNRSWRRIEDKARKIKRSKSVWRGRKRPPRNAPLGEVRLFFLLSITGNEADFDGNLIAAKRRPASAEEDEE